jgi:hypothetical protein
MKHRLSVAFGFATLLTGLTVGHEVHADTTISDLNFYASPFEAAFFSTSADYIGETFTTPGDNVLTNFTFVLDSSDGPIDLSIYGWDEADSKLVGNSLFTSAPNSGESDIFAFYTYTYNFDIPNLPLTANGSYVALLHGTNGFTGLCAEGGTLFYPFGDAYPGGQYVFGDSPNSIVTPFVKTVFRLL